MKTPSPNEVLKKQTKKGGWTKKTLMSWGVPWPPPKHWRRDLAFIWLEQQEQKQLQQNEKRQENN